MGKAGFAGKRGLDRNLVKLVERQASLIEIGPDLQGLFRADVGYEIDGVELRNLRQHGVLGVGADEIARIDQMRAHLAVEGRPDLGIAEVELGERDLRLGAEHIGLGGLFLVDPVIDVDLEVACCFRRSVYRVTSSCAWSRATFRGLELRLSRLKLGLVLVLLDGEQQVALLDDGAVLEMDLLEISRHAGDQQT